MRRDVAALDAKYTKELADAKTENDALRDDVAFAGRRRLHINSLSVSAWSHHRLRRGYYSLPPTADTAERDGLTLQRLTDRYAKTTGKTKYINEQCR